MLDELAKGNTVEISKDGTVVLISLFTDEMKEFPSIAAAYAWKVGT